MFLVQVMLYYLRDGQRWGRTFDALPEVDYVVLSHFPLHIVARGLGKLHREWSKMLRDTSLAIWTRLWFMQKFVTPRADFSAHGFKTKLMPQ